MNAQENSSDGSSETVPGPDGVSQNTFWYTDPGSGCVETIIQAIVALGFWFYVAMVVGDICGTSFWWSLGIVAVATGLVGICINVTYPGNRWSTIAKIPVILIGMQLTLLLGVIAFQSPKQPHQRSADRSGVPSTVTRHSPDEMVKAVYIKPASETYWKEAVWPMLRLRASFILTATEAPEIQHLIELKPCAQAVDAASSVGTKNVDPELVAMVQKHLKHDAAILFLADEVETLRSGKRLNVRKDRPLSEILTDLVSQDKARGSKQDAVLQQYRHDAVMLLAGYDDLARDAERMSARLEERYPNSTFPMVTAADIQRWRRSQ